MSVRVQRKHKPKNSNWGKAMPLYKLHGEQNISEFDRLTEKLGLFPDQYAQSSTLRKWVERNHKNHYVPEWLLLYWEIGIDCDDNPVMAGALALGRVR